MSETNRKRFKYYLRILVTFTITFLLCYILKAPVQLVTVLIIVLLFNILLVEMKIRKEQTYF